MNLKKKSNIYILLSILAIILAVGAIFYVKGKSETVASVNGDKITKTELYNLMVKQNGKEALNSLIAERIVDLEAQKRKIAVTDQEIQAELQKYYNDYGGQDAFLQALTSSGFTMDDVKKDIALSMKIRKLMEPRVAISDDELKAYFEENKASFAQEKQVKVSHILLDTKEKADEIKKRLANGEDFAKLAQENSTDTATRDGGGELGFIRKGEMVKEFDTAAFSLKVGQISDPVKTEFGYHLIKVDEIKEAQEANFEQSKPQIYEAVLQQKIEAEYNTWIEEMYQQYKIENSLAPK
ncbi:MAG: peptidylprolyl isomerase [Syntrophomonadaceae bacterium]